MSKKKRAQGRALGKGLSTLMNEATEENRSGRIEEQLQAEPTATPEPQEQAKDDRTKLERQWDTLHGALRTGAALVAGGAAGALAIGVAVFIGIRSASKPRK